MQRERQRQVGYGGGCDKFKPGVGGVGLCVHGWVSGWVCLTLSLSTPWPGPATEVTVEDWEGPGGPVTLRLDRQKYGSPQAECDALFTEARRSGPFLAFGS